MSYSLFVWKSSTRSKRRAVLTMCSVALALFVLCTLVTFINELERSLDDTSPLRLVTRHSVALTSLLPAHYRTKIENVPGVVAVTPFTWVGGIYIDRRHTDFAQFACDPAVLFDIYREIQIPPEQKQAFIYERTATIVGRRKAEKHGWKLGDRITLKGDIYPFDLELVVRGIFTGSPNDESQIFMHHKYLDEALERVTGRSGIAGTYWIRADSIESVPRIIETIDAHFRNTDAPTKTETERAFQMGFISMMGNLKGLIASISSVIIFTILLVTANTMAMSVRERTREVAVLKALGFGRRTILRLLMAEGVLITLTGGLLGCLGARALYSAVDMADFTQGVFQRFEVTWQIVVLGLGFAFVLGLLSTAVPAYRASNLTVAEGLRHVG